MLPKFYATGTATVAAGATAVTGTGTAWAGNVSPDDYFRAQGLAVRVVSVPSNTELTIEPWPGAALAAAAYEVAFTPDAVALAGATRELRLLLEDGILQALAAGGSGANKVPYYTGAAAVGLTDLSPFGRALLNLGNAANGKFIRATGAGTAVMQAIVGPVSQAGGVPTGAIAERGANANGEYVRFADGTQICTRPIIHDLSNGAPQSWTTPAAFAAPFAAAYGCALGSTQGWPEWMDNNGAVLGQTATSWTTRHFLAVAGKTIQLDLIGIGRWF